MLGRRLVVGAVLLLVGPLAALGQGRSRVAVFPPEGEAPPPLAGRIATSLAEAAVGARRDVVRTAVSLQDVLLTVECPEPTAACTAVAGRNLGVGEVLQIRLTRAGAGWRTEVTLFDVAGARVARRVERQLPADPGTEDLRQLGQAVFAITAAAPPPPATPARATWRLQLRPRTWVTLAVGAGLLVAGGVMGGLAFSTQQDFDAAGLPATSDPAAVRRFVDLADKGERYALTANVLYGLGAAAVALGSVLFYLDWHKVEIQPLAGPRTAGLALRRSF